MAASGELTPGNIPDDKIQSARDAARITLQKVYSDCLPTDKDKYNLALKYYTSHLLYTWGFGLPTISSSVGDVSITKSAPINLGDKTGLSPYYIEFEKLLECPDGEGPFLVSI